MLVGSTGFGVKCGVHKERRRRRTRNPPSPFSPLLCNHNFHPGASAKRLTNSKNGISKILSVPSKQVTTLKKSGRDLPREQTVCPKSTLFIRAPLLFSLQASLQLKNSKIWAGSNLGLETQYRNVHIGQTTWALKRQPSTSRPCLSI